MNTLETFYWAYENYKKEFENNRDIHLFRKGVNSRKSPEDYIQLIEVDCNIEEDWILAIERGINYIAKAIKEDRQFIRNEGEVLPIEKIRRVSKDSIQDLSKHSNYITRLPQNPEDPVIPEKLLMIKRENDYAIYENRVVYTTLCFLKDFIATRLDKIKEATNKYEGKVFIKKKIELGYRTVDVLIEINDIQKNDPIALARNAQEEKIKRLDLILNSVLVLLKTPLMQDLSKAPLVSRPVTKTNVLKMNTNFKESLACFDYVCAYNKDGFTITENVKKIIPLSEEQEDCYTDVILLSTFLAYRFNNYLDASLEEAFKKELKVREEIKANELLKKIKEVIGKVKSSGKNADQYIYELEEAHKILERHLEEAKTSIEELKEAHQKEIEELKLAHQKEIERIEQEDAVSRHELARDYQNICDELKIEYENQLNEFKQQHENDFDNFKADFLKEKDELNATIEQKNQEIIALSNQITQQQEEYTKLNNEKEKYRKQVDLAKAQKLVSTVEKSKDISPKDFTSKDDFDDLERQKAAMDEFFEKAWKETKKAIKKKHYNFKDEKKKKGGDK